MGVPTEQISLELLAEVLLLRAYPVSTNEIPSPVGPGNVAVVPKDASSTYPHQVTRDISRPLGAISISAQSRCLSSFRDGIAQTTPRALPSAVGLSGSSQLPVRRDMAPESFIRAYQFQLPLRQLSLAVGASTTVPGFRHPTTGTLPCAANDTLAARYDTGSVDQVIHNASPIFGNDTSPLFQMGMVVWPKSRRGTQRNLTVNLSAGPRPSGMMRDHGTWQSHLAMMLGHALPAGVRQCAGGSPTQPKNGGSVKSGERQKARQQGRKRPRRSNDDDDEPESNSRKGSGNSSNDKEETVDNEEYYCPYYLKNRIRHAACWKQKWRGSDIRRIKEHLGQKHLRWVCNSCNQAFAKKPEPHTCVVNGQRDYLDGFDYEQKDQLRSKDTIRLKSSQEYYNIVCKTLFPDDPPLRAHRDFTWEEMQDIHRQYDELQHGYHELQQSHDELQHSRDELQQRYDELQRVLDWLQAMRRRGLIHSGEFSSISNIVEGRSHPIPEGDALSSTARPSPIVMSQLDGAIADRAWRLQSNSVFDGEKLSNIDDSDMYGSPPASTTTPQPQQGSDSWPGTQSQPSEFMPNGLLPWHQYQEGPPASSVETAPSSSPPILSSPSLNSRDHDQVEYSSWSSLLEGEGMEYTDKVDSDGTPRSNMDGTDNDRPTNGARS